MAIAKIRIGIDVGGTFTKAIAIDNDTYKIIGKATTLTTHTAPEGVARGVLSVFHSILEKLDVDAKDVFFIAHSTTQATNALLEGDVAPVGIIGMGSGFDSLRARSLTNVRNIKLGPDRILKTYHKFIGTPERGELEEAIKKLASKGARVIVASEAFSVDDPTNELKVVRSSEKVGIPATATHEISKLYGLGVRTRTAVINASILPKMMETADMTEQSIRKTGIKAPLMIMRGDGGLMNINEMRKRPILTMLSGPSASVAGALMYLGVTDGIFFEVGGTSTNIGVIRKGKPMIKYVTLGGHETFLPSLDVRVLGVAGGSMPRIQDNKIFDVGPRSAHIAGLPYAAFSKTEDIKKPKLISIQPRPRDPNDYIAIKTANGKTIAITNTCAANVLGITKPGDYTHGNVEAARLAFEPLAKALGMTIEQAAERILEISSEKIRGVIDELIKEYELDRRTVVLVGGGGGAAALIPFTSEKTGLGFRISDNAEVISSIGVALAMVRDVVERTIVDPTEEDILRIRREAIDTAIKSGAAPETIEVFIEVQAARKRVRAIALGATELRTKDLTKEEVSCSECKRIIAETQCCSPEEVELIASTNLLDVFCSENKRKGLFGFLLGKIKSIIVMDRRGVIRFSASGASAFQTLAARAIQDLETVLMKFSDWGEGGRIIPGVSILHGGRILDLTGMSKPEQVIVVASTELEGMKQKDPVVLIVEPR